MVALFTLSGCAGGSSTNGTVDEITVAAASDLRPAFEQLGEAFEDQTSIRVTFVFGSSGQLKEQILNGAPFDVFASADASYVDEVIAHGPGLEHTRSDYAVGRIVLWSPDGAPPPAGIGGLANADYQRIAIAHPDHAPYGLAAVQALESAGIYDTVQPRLVYGDNISDAFRIAQSGNADVGIVALSLAIADGGAYTLIPSDLHEPLEQALVITSTGARGEAATAFASLIASPQGRAVMSEYGFDLPGQATAEQG